MGDDDFRDQGKGILHPEGMRAAKDLAAGVAHEVNNILGVIIGNAHLVKKNASNVEAVEKYVSEVRNAAEQGRELMRHLSILAGDGSLRARILSLNDLVTNAVSGIETPTKLDLSGEDPAVRVDLWLAQDALSSVARLMAATQAVTSIRIATRVVGSAVALTIEDDGATPGDKELRALFTPFAKIERRPRVRFELTKLAGLASRSDGYVTACAREPQGLRIVLTLPVVDGAGSGDGPGVPLSQEGA